MRHIAVVIKILSSLFVIVGVPELTGKQLLCIILVLRPSVCLKSSHRDMVYYRIQFMYTELCE